MEKLNLELILRRFITLFVFVILLFSPITIIEAIFYTIRLILYSITFPKNPYCFEFLKKMW
jgi:predicted membrane channel-forming protein YqfA (hemolysin III family)